MIKHLLFDLDNTLYPKSLGIFDLVIERIRNYMEVRLGYEKEWARQLRQEYLHKYGSTLRGLMIHQDIDPADYLEYVHDVGVEERLSPNPALGNMLGSIPLRKGDLYQRPPAPRATGPALSRGGRLHFPQIFDIVFTRYIPKPNPEPYDQILECIGREGKDCLMIEDIPANLKPAKDLGMTTVLVGETPGGMNGFVDYEIRDILQLNKVLELLG